MTSYTRLIILSLSFLILTQCQPPVYLEEGISRSLAGSRKQILSGIRYEIDFDIPGSTSEPIPGALHLIFNLVNKADDLILDFRVSGDKLLSVTNEGGAVDCSMQNEHIIIPAKYLVKGQNSFLIKFTAGETSLNRNKDYLYSLFVPDRASTAFPCFDQPDLKAVFTLSLSVPSGWTAITNGETWETSRTDTVKHITFEPTPPLPTYLFAFVAGVFDTLSCQRDGRSIRLFHRESDLEKLNNNADAIFAQVFNSIAWLEEYTQVDYPFPKYDLVAIPSFQYGGMEHPGAVLFRSDRLFLEKSATMSQKLNRASLIAHETAHMWFGGLVTMKWFDEVWLKEVFAGFMADKIVNPEFPGIDHKLKFLLGHYPRAYSVDRTMGTHPINQELENLKNAGAVYGDIIYHKAPIVMNHLEQIMGNEALQTGIQQYLGTYAYGNASWDDLIVLLEKTSGRHLQSWNREWIYEEGMPVITSDYKLDENNRLLSVRLCQADPFNRKRLWMQPLDLYMRTMEDTLSLHALLDGPSFIHNYDREYSRPLFLVPNSSGSAYGYFRLDQGSLDFLLAEVRTIQDPVMRGAVWLDLYENFLNKRIDPLCFLSALANSIHTETEDLLVNELLSMLKTTFWKFLDKQERLQVVDELEGILWEELMNRPDQLQYYFYEAYLDIALTADGVNRLYELWNGDIKVDGLSLSERDHLSLVLELAARGFPGKQAIYNTQLMRTKDPELRDMLTFVYPATSQEDSVCTHFFDRIRDPVNRGKEPWVISALSYLHHPLRDESNIAYLKPSLEMLEEIQLTGDIFFPKNWLDATFSGYSSAEAAGIITDFLGSHPDYPGYLKLKILQSADMIGRATD